MLDAIGSLIGGLIFTVGFALLALLYFLPTIVVLLRRAHDVAGVVVVLNVFLGWTFLGWVASLAMAMAGSSNPRPIPHPGYVPPYAYPAAPAVQTSSPTGGSRNGDALVPTADVDTQSMQQS
jgi:hypothetical protein